MSDWQQESEQPEGTPGGGMEEGAPGRGMEEGAPGGGTEGTPGGGMEGEGTEETGPS